MAVFCIPFCPPEFVLFDQHAGKTTFVNVIATGGYNEDMIPTVGFNMRKITKGNVTIKLWDIGGQPRFRLDTILRV